MDPWMWIRVLALPTSEGYKENIYEINRPTFFSSKYIFAMSLIACHWKDVTGLHCLDSIRYDEDREARPSRFKHIRVSCQMNGI